MPVKLQQTVLPQEIERLSFEIIERELGPNLPFQGEAWEIARRLVHTSADYSLLPDLVLPPEAIESGVRAILAGTVVLTDTEMARSGMPPRRLAPFGVRVQCMHSLPGVAEQARQRGITRAKAGIEAARGMLPGAIVALGNAPTALLAVLDYLREGNTPPALIIAMPVGFVNAAESKELLLAGDHGAPALVLRGRRGGSPLVAAAVNALAEIALRRAEKSSLGQG